MSIQSIGIDVSKDTLDIALYDDKKKFESFTLKNSDEGFKKLLKILTQHETTEAVPCVLESTGMYHLPVSLMLRQSGRRVNCINPIMTKMHQLSSVRKAKTDKIDAKRLAYMGVAEPNLPEFNKQTRDIYLKRILRMIATLDKEIQRMKLATDNFRQFVQMLNLPEKYCDELRQLVLQMKKQKKILIKELIENVPQSKMFDDILGVSRESGAILLSSFSGMNFKSRDSLVAYVGLDVSVRQSGQFRGRGKLSKRGNAFVRKTLHQVAWGLKQHNQTYREYYDSLRARNVHYTTCLNAIARKFLRYLYLEMKNA